MTRTATIRVTYPDHIDPCVEVSITGDESETHFKFGPFDKRIAADESALEVRSMLEELGLLTILNPTYQEVRYDTRRSPTI